MALDNLESMFTHELEDIYSAEQDILDTLDELVEETQDENIVDVLRQHRNETEEQIDRIEQVFDELDETPSEEECEGIQGLIQEHEEIKSMDPSPELLNVANVMSAMKTEHYEISAYNSLSLLANRLGMQEAEQLLQQNLNEEQEMLNRLGKLADGYDFDSIQQR